MSFLRLVANAKYGLQKHWAKYTVAHQTLCQDDPPVLTYGKTLNASALDKKNHFEDYEFILKRYD